MLRAKGIYRMAIMLLAGASALWAEDTGMHGMSNVTRFHSSYFTIGGTLLDADKLNAAIQSNGYHAIKNYSIQAGGGFDWQANRLIGGGELFGYFWKKQTQAANLTQLYGIGGRLNIGVNVLPAGPVRLYPMVAFGTGRLWLKLAKEEVNFSDIVAAPVNEISLSQRTVVFEPGLGFDYTLGHKKRGDGSLLIGLRAGYSFDASDANDWRSDGVGIAGGPEMRASGPYLRLIIGNRAAKAMKKSGECTKA